EIVRPDAHGDGGFVEDVELALELRTDESPEEAEEDDHGRRISGRPGLSPAHHSAQIEQKDLALPLDLDRLLLLDRHTVPRLHRRAVDRQLAARYLEPSVAAVAEIEAQLAIDLAAVEIDVLVNLQ